MPKSQEIKPHAVMIPLPLQGHVKPFLNLAMKLASNGFIITFVNTRSVHRQILKARPLQEDDKDGDGEVCFFSDFRGAGLDIRYTTMNDGLPVGYELDLTHNENQFAESMLRVFPVEVDKLVGGLAVSSDPPVTCLIADTFYSWPSTVARKHGLINISFWTEPALVLNLYYHIDLLRKNGHFGSQENREDAIDYIPGIKSINPKDLVSYLQDKDTSSLIHQLTFMSLGDVKNADFIVCNTVEELEDEALVALNQNIPTYAVGPIISSPLNDRFISMSLWLESDCIHWLETKQTSSVLFISFGSLVHPTEHDVVEIAQGLVMSKVDFIWVLRPNSIISNGNQILPYGFEDQVQGRGLIVPWCSQIDVISHPAIGGFLTHCGWNSILESIRCSVPILCYPFLSDQITNRKLVVDDWKIGINLCDGKMITREEVAEKINCFMGDDKVRDELRKKINLVRITSENALTADHGSSHKNFNQFIKEVKVKIQKN